MDQQLTKPTKTTTTTSTTTTTCLFFLSISFFLFVSSFDRMTYSSSSYSPVLPLLIAFLIVLLIVFAVRTTIVTWITVMVLLAFAGKRRRILVKEGRKITSDIAMHLAQIVVEERSFVAFVCATIGSLLALAWVRVANQTPM
ncbi:UNVERIFIED_CONTAM: hypothetical protein Scaly_2603200 [Sesamum calycinum]|uniref:Transmembrane protein n=1 Tax=Sesamum calycinum TaxID=2727403 RepID=A0AAW2JC28_9LAMI